MKSISFSYYSIETDKWRQRSCFRPPGCKRGQRMLQLTAEQVLAIQHALNSDKRREIVIKVENGHIVVLCNQKKRIA